MIITQLVITQFYQGKSISISDFCDFNIKFKVTPL